MITNEDIIAAFLAVGIAVSPPDPELFPPPTGEWTITRIATNYTVTTSFPEFADQQELDDFVASIDVQVRPG